MPSGTSSAVKSTRVPLSTAHTVHVIVIVPANAGSSDSKVDRLDHAIVGDDVEIAGLDDVGVG